MSSSSSTQDSYKRKRHSWSTEYVCGFCFGKVNELCAPRRVITNNFQRVFYCPKKCSCLVICEACQEAGEHPSVFVVYQNATEHDAVANAKRNHQRRSVSTMNIHAAFATAEATAKSETTAKAQRISPDGSEHEEDDFFAEQEYQPDDAEQVVPPHVLQLHCESNKLPGDTNLGNTRLPTTKMPPQYRKTVVGCSLPDDSKPSIQHAETDFGVRPSSIVNANLCKPLVTGSTKELKEQLNNLAKLGPVGVFKQAVGKTFGINANGISPDQLLLFKQLHSLSEDTTWKNWNNLSSVLRQQEKNTVKTAVNAATNDIIEFLKLYNYEEASTLLGQAGMEDNIVDNILRRLHPEKKDSEYHGLNMSAVPQTAADIRRLIKNVRATVPVPAYKMVSPHWAACPLADLIAIMMAQESLNLNAVIPNTVPSTVTSVYQSKEVIDGKTEWVDSCVYWRQNGWETFPVGLMSLVLAKAKEFNTNKTAETCTLVIEVAGCKGVVLSGDGERYVARIKVNGKSEDLAITYCTAEEAAFATSDQFRAAVTAQEVVTWTINFGTRYVLIADSSGNNVECPLIFGVHYRVEANIVGWIDGAKSADVRQLTRKIEQVVVSICFDGRHVFRHNTVFCWMIALDDRFDPQFASRFMEAEVTKFNKYHGRLVYSQKMKRAFVLSLRVIAFAVDRPERNLQRGTSSGQQASRFGRIEGLLFDINNREAVAALLESNFNVDVMLQEHPEFCKVMNIEVAETKCRDFFLASVARAKGTTFAKLKDSLQPFGPNTKTILDVFEATKTYVNAFGTATTPERLAHARWWFDVKKSTIFMASWTAMHWKHRIICCPELHEYPEGSVKAGLNLIGQFLGLLNPRIKKEFERLVNKTLQADLRRLKISWLQVQMKPFTTELVSAVGEEYKTWGWMLPYLCAVLETLECPTNTDNVAGPLTQEEVDLPARAGGVWDFKRCMAFLLSRMISTERTFYSNTDDYASMYSDLAATGTIIVAHAKSLVKTNWKKKQTCIEALPSRLIGMLAALHSLAAGMMMGSTNTAFIAELKRRSATFLSSLNDVDKCMREKNCPPRQWAMFRKAVFAGTLMHPYQAERLGSLHYLNEAAAEQTFQFSKGELRRQSNLKAHTLLTKIALKRNTLRFGITPPSIKGRIRNQIQSSSVQQLSELMTTANAEGFEIQFNQMVSQVHDTTTKQKKVIAYPSIPFFVEHELLNPEVALLSCWVANNTTANCVYVETKTTVMCSAQADAEYNTYRYLLVLEIAGTAEHRTTMRIRDRADAEFHEWFPFSISNECSAACEQLTTSAGWRNISTMDLHPVFALRHPNKKNLFYFQTLGGKQKKTQWWSV